MQRLVALLNDGCDKQTTALIFYIAPILTAFSSVLHMKINLGTYLCQMQYVLATWRALWIAVLATSSMLSSGAANSIGL